MNTPVGYSLRVAPSLLAGDYLRTPVQALPPPPCRGRLLWPGKAGYTASAWKEMLSPHVGLLENNSHDNTFNFIH
jgi:hypothetical protein